MSHHHHGHDHTTEIDWEKLAPLLEVGAELDSPLYRQSMSWLGELLPPDRVRRVLDIGSGPGVQCALLAAAFPHAELVAVDTTPHLLERARGRARREGFEGRFHTRRIELPHGVAELGEADLIWMGSTLHHIGDQRAMLGEVARLLRPGGLLALVEGGLPTRSLPRDIQLGRPGIEARMDAAHAEWFTAMRAALPEVKEEVEDWRGLLAAVGLSPEGSRTFLLDIPAPAPRKVRDHRVHSLEQHLDVLAERLDEDDIAVLRRLLDPDDPAGLARRADVYLLSARTVHTARRLAGS